MISIRTLAALLFLAPVGLAGTHYVDANLTTGLNDGTSWDNAFQGDRGLRDAMLVVAPGDQVFVAQGTYRPAIGSNRAISFILLSGVELYGGFLGGENSPSERPPLGSAPSVLDGDLGENDGGGMLGDNSYHVVRSGTADSTGVLDGFVVRAGNANASGNNNKGAGILCLNGSPTIRNCHFIDHRCTFGGAAGYINGAGPSFLNCIFEAGDGGSFGGAFDIANGDPVLFDRCMFKGNTAARAGALEIFATAGVVVANSVFIDNVATGNAGGGGLWAGSGGNTLVLNCTFVGNLASNHAAGGLHAQGATVLVANGIFWDNEGMGGAQGTDNQILGGLVNNTIVEGGHPGVGNLGSDPAFVDIAGRDLHLTLASPAIDAGDNVNIAGLNFDRAHAPRFVDEPSVADTGVGSAPIVDMGAFESSIGISDPYCVPLANSTGLTSVLVATGSQAVVDNDVNFVVTELPTSEFGYFLMSATANTIPVASGVLCLGGPQLRFSSDVLNSGAGGALAFTPDLGNLPQGQVVLPGETWYFQLWHRDGASSNFSSSLRFTWE